MTTFIVDEQTSLTPIGEFFQSATDGIIEVRDEAGKLLATVIVPAGTDEEDRLYEELQQLCEQEADLLRERMSRSPTEGLTTAELIARLQQLSGDE